MVEQTLTQGQLIARFRAIRKARGKSVQTVSDATGIPRAVLSNLETGRREVLSIDEARLIATALGVDLLACLRPEAVEIITRTVVAPAVRSA